MPVRSTKLASIKPPANVVTQAFVVPAGMTYLVKDILVQNAGGASEIATVALQDPGGLIVDVIAGFVVSAGLNSEWSGWVALNPGDQLTVKASVGNLTFWVSGTKLPGIA